MNLSGLPPIDFNGYLLRIEVYNNGNSYWALERWDMSVPATLDEGWDNPNINAYFDAKNVIKVYCREDTIEVYFNDAYITTVYDGMYWDGHVGLFAYRSTAENDFRFDNVSLWRRRDWKEDEDH